MNEQVKDPGVGAFSKDKAQRFINTSGNFNVRHVNKKSSINEAYTYLIKISWSRFFLILAAVFFVINSLFGFIYVILGVDNIGVKRTDFFTDFINAVFFSVQTLTTLGYGYFSPNNIPTGIVSSIEAIIGLISFAFITGLIYGRFSKPSSNIRFSKDLLLCTYRGKDALMFRVLSGRKGMALLPKAQVSLSLSRVNEEGELKNQFYELKLERDSIMYLPTTWTLVHPIDKNSPLFGYTREEIKTLQAEMMILFSYQDEYFNEELHQAYSYLFNELKVGYKFKKAFYFDDDGQTVLDHDKFDAITADS